MKHAWQRLGSPDAISWVIGFLLFMQQLSGSLVAPFADINGRVGEFLALRIISLGVMMLVLWVGKLLLVRFASQRPLPWLTLAVFVVATVAGTVAVNGLLIAAGFTNEWNLGRRLLVAIPGVFTILVLSAVLVSLGRELARENRELADTADELVRTRTEAAARIDQRKHELVATVQGELSRALGSLREQSSDHVAQDLKSLIDDVVRPLSYQLSNDVKTHKPRAIEISDPKISWTDLLRNALDANPAHPIALTLWLGSLMGTFLISGLGLRGLLATLAMCALSLATFAVVRIAWPRLPDRMNVWAHASVFSAILLVFATATAPLLQSISGYQFTAPVSFAGWLMLTFFMSWTVTLIFAVRDTLRATQAALSTTVDELKREVIQLNNELRRLQKGISRVLHGPIQEVISASIYRLQSDLTTEQAAELMRDVQRRVDAAIELLNNPSDAQIDIDASLNDLIELWDEVVDIRINMSTGARAALVDGPIVTDTVITLIREACSNAIRHGEARHINVTVSRSRSSDLIELIVDNDGRPLPAAPKPSVGSQLFDDMCMHWQRTQLGERVHLEALVPLTM